MTRVLVRRGVWRLEGLEYKVLQVQKNIQIENDCSGAFVLQSKQGDSRVQAGLRGCLRRRCYCLAHILYRQGERSGARVCQYTTICKLHSHCF